MSDNLIVFALKQESQDFFNDHDVLYTGVGKINAAYFLLKRIHQKRPKMVINLGTAGSSLYSREAIVCANQFIQRDMDVSPLGFLPGQTPFSDEPILLSYGETIEGIPSAVCGTGDNFDIAHNQNDYTLVDMEAYALAKVCKAEAIPFLCIKYISDGADGSAAKDWNEILFKAAEALKGCLTEKVLKI